MTSLRVLSEVFSPTKMENGAKRGVLFMKKHCWEIRSSPHEVKVFFRNPTLNSHFKSRFFLVLPTVHPVDGWVSLEERFVKCRMHEWKHTTEGFNYLIQIQLTFSTKYAIVSSFSFSFSPSEHGNKQPIQNQIKFDWSFGFSEPGVLVYVCPHISSQTQSCSLFWKSTTSL